MANTSSISGTAHKDSESIPDKQLVLTDDIRSRAYQLYESRGKEDCHDLEDWLVAEQEARDRTGS